MENNSFNQRATIYTIPIVLFPLFKNTVRILHPRDSLLILLYPIRESRYLNPNRIRTNYRNLLVKHSLTILSM